MISVSNLRVSFVTRQRTVEAVRGVSFEVREDATHFLLVPGHEETDIERVVERRGPKLAVVEKFERVVARAVRQLDPRTEPA